MTNLSSEQEIASQMEKVLFRSVEPVEIPIKAALIAEINRLAKEKNAIILKHLYMEPALAEFVSGIKGDSLELSRRAAAATEDIIVFCGVRFMAETAKILNPNKTVLLPAAEAGCSLASSITGENVRKLKEQFPGVPVLLYVNSYAETKAEADVCCTSTNVNNVIKWALTEFKTDRVLCLPDQFLAANAARELGMNFVSVDRNYQIPQGSNLQNTVIGWPGTCEVHERYSQRDVSDLRATFPGIRVAAHPECRPEVTKKVDFVGSTSAMIKFVEREKGPGVRFAILTECAMGEGLRASHPDADVVGLCSYRCPHMAQITLENVRDALLNKQYEITVPENIRYRSELSLKRMVAIN